MSLGIIYLLLHVNAENLINLHSFTAISKINYTSIAFVKYYKCCRKPRENVKFTLVFQILFISIKI